jgi:hypothetical protein
LMLLHVLAKMCYKVLITRFSILEGKMGITGSKRSRLI